MVRGPMVRGPMAHTMEAAAPYFPSPRRGEGRGGCGLRRRQTEAERRVWARLRDRRLLGSKFARQVPIGPYVDRVLRFWNNEALGNTDGVLQRVAEALVARPSPRLSPRRGEGEGRG